MDNENQNKPSDIDDLKRLLKLNLQKNEEILAISKKTKQYIKWQQIWSILRFLLILIPIVLGFIYLPPVIRDFIKNYRSFLK